MQTSFQLQYFGRGAAKVPMPRAVAREARKDWIIHPSFIILVLAVAITISFKVTISNKKLFKDTKTIILLPEAPPVPEPTVKKKIPLIKVLQDAVKKTVEPKKIEFKKIIPAKPKPKKIKPKTVTPKKLAPLKVQPKKIVLNPLTPQKVIPKKLNINKVPSNKIPVAPRVPTNATPSKVNPKPQFHAMIPVVRSTIPAHSSRGVQPVRSVSPAIIPKGSVPQLTQRVEYKPHPKKKLSISRPVSATLSPTPVPVAKMHIQPSKEANPLKTVSLVIQGSTIDNSSRVKSLKMDIRKKALNMSEHKSPYTYMVKGYQCTVTIKGNTNKKVNIKFLPADAPFEVVSALERMLPR